MQTTQSQDNEPQFGSQQAGHVRRPLYLFLAPRYWLIWIALGLMRASCWLSYPTQIRLARAVGRVMHAVLSQRRLIAHRNIQLCFPELDEAEHAGMVKAHFESLGACLIEMALGWWASDAKLDRLMSVEGIEHLERALADGNGAILLTAHFTSIEASGRLFARLAPPFKAVYRTDKNPLFDEMLRRGRGKTAIEVIPKDDLKTILRTLRANTPVLYAPDQAYRRKLSALVPFFSVPAMCNIATSQIATKTGARVLPYLPIRLPDDRGYLLTIGPPIDGFPSDDPVADTVRYHRIIEEHIRKDPAQYYWVHRKFKDRPEAYPDAYANLAGAPSDDAGRRSARRADG